MPLNEQQVAARIIEVAALRKERDKLQAEANVERDALLESLLPSLRIEIRKEIASAMREMIRWLED
jgi:phage host-nuclease inhibitor protein Gam